MNVKKIFSNIAIKIWYFLAFLIVLMAVLVVVSRLMTPMLNRSRHFFEEWASRYIGMPITVSHLRAGWRGLEPDLNFENVDLYDKNQSKVILHVADIEINIDLIHSLFNKSLMPRKIAVSGVALKIKQQSVDEFSLDGFQKAPDQNNDDDRGARWLLWVLSQPETSLSDASIQLVLMSGQTVPLMINQLEIRNHLNSHHCSGQMHIDGDSTMQVNFGALFEGEASQWAESKILTYASIQNASLAALNLKKEIGGYAVQQGIVNSQIWAIIQNKKIQSVQSDINVKNLKLSTNNKKIKLTNFSGNFLWQNTENGWQLQGDKIQLDTPKGPWKKNKLSIAFQQQGDLTSQQIYLEYLNVSDVLRWVPDRSSLSPAGDLTQIELKHQGAWQDLNNYDLTANFSNVNFKPFGNFPGINNLSGKVVWVNKKGSVRIHSDNSALVSSIYKQPVILNFLNGLIEWHQKENGDWEINAPKLSALNDDVALHAQVGVLIPAGHSEKTTLSLLLGYRFANSNVVKNYFPRAVMDQKLDEWLSRALSGDQPLNGTTILRGNISDFPFDRSQKGTFYTDVKLQGVNVHYDDEWPDVKNITGDLIFDKRRMQVNINHGTVAGTTVTHIEAVMPNLGQKDKPLELMIDSELNADAKQLFHFVNHSPLKKTVGKALSPLDVQGELGLKLHLFIPIDRPKGVKVSGDLSLPDVDLNAADWRIHVSHLTGNVLFDDDLISSKNLKGVLMNAPVSFQIKTLPSPKTLQILVDGSVEMKSLMDYLEWQNISYLQGLTAYHAALSIGMSDVASLQNSLLIHSDLFGVDVDLPEPLNKTKKQIKPFDVRLYFGANKPTELFLVWKKQLSAGMLLKENQNTHLLELFSGHLQLGDKPPTIQEQSGWFIDGDLPVFNAQTLQSWKTFFEKNQASTNQTIKSDIKKQLKKISLNIGKIDLFDQQTENAKVNISPEEQAWRIGIDSSDAVGYLLLPYRYPDEPLVAQFEKLNVKTGKSSSNLSSADPSSIPALNLNIDQLQYNQKPLGTLSLKIHPSENTLWIDGATFKSPLLTGNVTGKWEKSNDQNQTSLSGTLESDDISTLLSQNNVSSSLIVKSGGLTFDLSWPDVINRFDVSKATGHISAEMQKGWIIDLGDRADSKLNTGRLVTLLSIHRLLVMDFSDLTHKGYSFDKMIGDFDLNQGNIVTNNLMFDGAVAYIGVTGQIHAVKKTLNLLIEVEPHITSSLPVVATLVGGPIAGAVAFAANKVIGNAISRQIAHYHYQVTGSWQKPIVKELSTAKQ